MDTEKLNRIILKFWKSEHNNDVYYLGLCSEFAVALQRYLGGKGEITKHGLWHTVLKYNGMYCDIHGCMTENKLNFTMPIGGVGVNESTRKARPDEVAHIYGLLNERMTKHIYDGLKKAEKEI